MKRFPITAKPFGTHAILLEWPQQVDATVLSDILHFEQFLKAELQGEWECIPAYNSLTLVKNTPITDIENLQQRLLGLYGELEGHSNTSGQLWSIPVCYDKEFGFDLEEVAANLEMSEEAVISHHTANVYIVYGIGFLPGFMYLGGLPQNLEIVRRAMPRLHVPKGSVGLAGKQTGIYPQDSPGGWNIIGNSPVPLFNTDLESPCFVKVGDRIQFKAISRAEYELHRIEAEVGIYEPKKQEKNA